MFGIINGMNRRGRQKGWCNNNMQAFNDKASDRQQRVAPPGERAVDIYEQ